MDDDFISRTLAEERYFKYRIFFSHPRRHQPCEAEEEALRLRRLPPRQRRRVRSRPLLLPVVVLSHSPEAVFPYPPAQVAHMHGAAVLGAASYSTLRLRIFVEYVKLSPVAAVR